MSKGYMGPGALMLSWLETLKVVGIILGIMFCVIGGIFWAVNKQTAAINAERDAAYAARHFNTGDIVRTKIGMLRGTILSVQCYKGCSYYVRFPVASMEQIWVNEYEIELAKEEAR